MSFESKLDKELKKEKESVQDLYLDILNSIQETSDYISDDEKSIRPYIHNSIKLKEYIDKLTIIENKTKNNGIMGIIKDNKYLNEFYNLKEQYQDVINSLLKCNGCQCINCIQICKFNACRKCLEVSHIEKCDKKHMNKVTYKDRQIELENDYGNINYYTVLATIEDLDENKEYILIENTDNPEDKFILRLIRDIREDIYEEITNDEELDKIERYYNSN